MRVKISYGEWRMFKERAPGLEDMSSYRVMTRRGDSVDWETVEVSPAELRGLIETAEHIFNEVLPYDHPWPPLWHKRAAENFLSRIDDLSRLASAKGNPMKPGWELWLNLDEIEPFVPLMRQQGVSEVARSKRGFLTAYKKAGGDADRLGSDPKFGQNWVKRRNNFVARHMGQITKRGEDLWRYGNPTRRHLALIAWAYTPDYEGLQEWIGKKGKRAAANPDWGDGVPPVEPVSEAHRRYLEWAKAHPYYQLGVKLDSAAESYKKKGGEWAYKELVRLKKTVAAYDAALNEMADGPARQWSRVAGARMPAEIVTRKALVRLSRRINHHVRRIDDMFRHGNPYAQKNPDLLRRVPPEIKKLAHEIQRYGKGGRAVLIGGSVIDLLQGRTPKDWDIEVHGYTYPKLEQIMRTLGYSPKTVGRQFGILIVRVGNHDVDLSIPRKESKVGVGHKGFKVTFPKMTPKEAAQRRDFTINAMGVDLSTGELLDPWNGMADLRRGVLRATDPRTFVEDPLRGLRAMQLLARKAKSVDAATMGLIQQLSSHYRELAKERVFEEFNKLLMKAKKPSVGLQFLRHSGWLRWFPELQAQIGVPQRHEWHSEGDVWNHMLLTVNQAARIRHCIPEEHRLAFMYGAMLHDVGKPATTRLEREPPEMYLTAHGHDVAGKEPAESFMRRLTDDKRLIAKVKALVGEHMQPYNLTQAEAGLPAYVRLTKRLREHGVDLPLLSRISQADKAGSLRPGEPHKYLDPETCEPSWDHRPTKNLAWAHGEIERRGILKAKRVQGRDLLAMGYDPKKLMKKGIFFKPALDAAFQAQMDHPDWSDEQLLSLAQQVMEQQIKAKGNPSRKRKRKRRERSRRRGAGEVPAPMMRMSPWGFPSGRPDPDYVPRAPWGWKEEQVEMPGLHLGDIVLVVGATRSQGFKEKPLYYKASVKKVFAPFPPAEVAEGAPGWEVLVAPVDRDLGLPEEHWVYSEQIVEVLKPGNPLLQLAALGEES
jgi:tRNA nucleotidyltransferase (CCA-adding enzyme)